MPFFNGEKTPAQICMHLLDEYVNTEEHKELDYSKHCNDIDKCDLNMLGNLRYIIRYKELYPNIETAANLKIANTNFTTAQTERAWMIYLLFSQPTKIFQAILKEVQKKDFANFSNLCEGKEVQISTSCSCCTIL